MRFQPAPGAVVGGKYRLERALAGGGMGSVWIAVHTTLDAKVAVKFIARDLLDAPSALARFEREAKATAQLSSPHVVRVHDFGVEDGLPFMVMELLEGEDLGARLDRVGRLSLAEAAEVTVAIGKALRAAHDVGLVHRDLKPRNVFLAQQSGDTVVKLLDFGIARETKSKMVDDRTSSGLVLGSPYHMAPEQAQGLAVDHRADLWALGVVLYRALTGRRPFEGDSVTIVLLAICSRPHPPPSSVTPDLPPALDGFFRRALAKEPEGRFPSAEAMVGAFLEAAGLPVAAPGLRLADGSVPSLRGPAPSSSDVVARADATRSEPGAAASIRAELRGPRDVEGATPSATSARDLSGSRELSAVSTGVTGAVAPPSRRRLVLASGLALLLGVVVAALVVGRSPPRDVAAAAPSSAPVDTSSAAPAVAPPAPPPPPTPSVAPMASASVPAVASEGGRPASRPPSAPRPPRTAAPTSAPTGAPAVDPFTGLPVGR